MPTTRWQHILALSQTLTTLACLSTSLSLAKMPRTLIPKTLQSRSRERELTKIAKMVANELSHLGKERIEVQIRNLERDNSSIGSIIQ